MTIGSILLSIALLLLTALYIMRPFLMYQPTNDEKALTLTAVEEKEQLVQQIRALDHEFEMGKIAEIDYKQERQQLMIAAATRLQQIDNATLDVDAQIKAAIEKQTA